MRPEKRPYLRADQRRQHLLDAAGRIFQRDGLNGMSMVALAAEAGVSRRLIYDHFDSLSALYTAFFADRMASYLAASEARLTSVARDAPAMTTEVFNLLIGLPPDNLRAVRLLMADTANRDLEEARQQFRTHLAARWLPVFPEAVPTEVAMAVVHSVLTSFLTLAAEVATRMSAGITRSMPGVVTAALAPSEVTGHS